MGYLGNSAWLYDSAAATTTRVGFFDAEHTQSDGYQYSDAYLLNQSGLAAGQSARFSGASYLGESAWVYDSAAATTTRVGLVGAEHTQSDGYRYSFVDWLSESNAAGRSGRFSGTSFVGESAWVYDNAGGTTTRVGFFDANHTRSDGYQGSYVNVLNDSGLAAGQSERYAGGNYMGQSAWLYDSAGATTTRLGLFDAFHTRSDGYQESYVNFLNDAGLAAGGSARFGGSASYLGDDAWVYDASTNSHYTITFSTRSDGYALSYVSFLGEDGLALGSYELFDSLDNYLGTHAFAWTASDGAVDLGALVSGLGAAGWSRLAETIRANGLGQIVGSGRLASGGDLAYLLIPVPEPGTLLLLTLGLGGVALTRPRSIARGRSSG